MTDIGIMKSDEVGLFSSALAAPLTAIAQRYSRVFLYTVAADAAANTNLAEIGAAPLEYAGKITVLKIRPEAAVAANTTNYAVVTAAWRSSTNASTTVGTVNTAAAGALVGWVPVAFTITNTATQAFTASSQLTIKHDKYGAGAVQLPAYTVTVVAEDT